MPTKFPVPGSDTHYYIFEVDAGGFHEDANDDGKTIVPDLVALLSSPTSAYTDVVVFSHGYNTQRSSPGGPLPIANNVFSSMHAVRPANCNPLYVAIFWPSSLHTMHHEAEDDNRMRFENIMKVLRGELSNALDSLSPAAETAMDAADEFKDALSTTAGMLAKETRVSGAADCLLDDTEAADVPGSKAAVDARDVSLESKLEKAAELDSKAAPLEQGLPEPEAKRRRTLFYLAQDIVFGQFERRASVVGSRGVHVLLASLMRAAKEHVRFHLFGHSLGCHVVCSAAIGRAPGNVLNRKVHTLFMAQGAMESSVFSKGGPYRPIVSMLKPVAGPIVLTTSPFDSALKTYDIFHSSPVGVVGVENTDPFPKMTILLEKKSGGNQQVFNFNKETFHVLDGRNVITAADGSLFTGGSHGDIMDAETMHAFWQAASVKLRSEDMQVTSRSALPDGYWTKYRVRAENDWRPWSYCSLM